MENETSQPIREAGRRLQAAEQVAKSMSTLDLHARSTTLEIKACSCTRGQKGRTVALRLVQTVKRDPSQRGAFVPNKVCFCTKLFKNTIFTMYEWWRFQRYRICLKKLEIRISIEKLNFFLVHLEGSIQTKLKLDKKPKTQE